jgi:hypothetical protein
VLWSLFTQPVKLKKEPAWSALNLFFDGNGSTPGISVFGALDNSSFEPDNGNTLMLTGSSPNTPPAATLGLSEASGAPYAKLMATGTSFAANETVEIFAGPIGASPVFATATADASGSFSVAGRAPQHPLGPMDVYAVGESSHRLGATTLSVTPALAVTPGTSTPGASATANVLGFGADERVNVYWNEPRQLLGSVTSSPLGSGSLAITIPGNASSGTNVVVGVGETTKAIGIGAVRVE